MQKKSVKKVVKKKGDKGNICLIYEDEGVEGKVYFYTHWRGSNMREIIRQALIRGKDRWDDAPYLARIIFSELIKDDILGLTGYGIAPFEMDRSKLVFVDLKEQEADGMAFDEYILKPKPLDHKKRLSYTQLAQGMH